MDGFLSCGAAGMVEDDDERASQWLCVNSCVSADGRLARAGSSGGGDELRANPSMPPPSIPTAHEYLENQTEVSRVQDEIIYELMQRLKEHAGQGGGGDGDGQHARAPEEGVGGGAGSASQDWQASRARSGSGLDRLWAQAALKTRPHVTRRAEN